MFDYQALCKWNFLWEILTFGFDTRSRSNKSAQLQILHVTTLAIDHTFHRANNKRTDQYAGMHRKSFQIWCVSHKWGMQQQISFCLGPWGVVKRSNIIKFPLQSQFQRFFYTKLCVCSHE